MDAGAIVAHECEPLGFRRMAHHDFRAAALLDVRVMLQRTRALDAADVLDVGDARGQLRGEAVPRKARVEHPDADIDPRRNLDEPLVDHLFVRRRIIRIDDDCEIGAHLLRMTREVHGFVG